MSSDISTPRTSSGQGSPSGSWLGGSATRSRRSSASTAICSRTSRTRCPLSSAESPLYSRLPRMVFWSRIPPYHGIFFMIFAPNHPKKVYKVTKSHVDIVALNFNGRNGGGCGGLFVLFRTFSISNQSRGYSDVFCCFGLAMSVCVLILFYSFFCFFSFY